MSLGPIQRLSTVWPRPAPSAWPHQAISSSGHFSCFRLRPDYQAACSSPGICHCRQSSAMPSSEYVCLSGVGDPHRPEGRFLGAGPDGLRHPWRCQN